MTLEDSRDYFYQSPFVYAKYLSRLITAIAREKKGIDVGSLHFT